MSKFETAKIAFASSRQDIIARNDYQNPKQIAILCTFTVEQIRQVLGLGTLPTLRDMSLVNLSCWFTVEPADDLAVLVRPTNSTHKFMEDDIFALSVGNAEENQVYSNNETKFLDGLTTMRNLNYAPINTSTKTQVDFRAVDIYALLFNDMPPASLNEKTVSCHFGALTMENMPNGPLWIYILIPWLNPGGLSDVPFVQGTGCPPDRCYYLEE